MYKKWSGHVNILEHMPGVSQSWPFNFNFFFLNFFLCWYSLTVTSRILTFQEAKEHLGALADKLGPSLTDIDVCWGSYFEVRKPMLYNAHLSDDAIFSLFPEYQLSVKTPQTPSDAAEQGDFLPQEILVNEFWYSCNVCPFNLSGNRASNSNS